MSVVRRSIFAVALMASGAAYAGTPGWSVSESSGPVFVAKPGLSKTSAITRGAALSAGDVISTGKGGRAVIVRGGEYLTVAPNTKVQLTEPKAGALTQIIQSFGNVVFKIQKKTTPHFQVETPYLAAVVKGTTFSVTVTPAGASVQVTEGLVQVQSLDGLASRFVSPGEIGMISSAAPGQLSVLGAPNAPSGGATVVGAPAPVAAPDGGSESRVEPAASPVSEIAEVRIASPIGEGNVNLAAQTGGIVSGNSSLTQAAMVEAVFAQPTVDTPATAPVVAEAAPAASVIEAAPAVVAEATPAPAIVETPATVVAEVTPPTPVVEATPALVAEAAPAPAVSETPAAVVAEVTPPTPVVEAPPALVVEAAPAPAIVETPAAVVAEVTPPMPAVEAPPALVAEAAPAPAVVEAPATIVAEVTPPAPSVEAPPALVVEAAPAPAVVETPAAVVAEVTPPAAAPVLVATLETPSAAAPTVPAVAAGNANLGAGSSGSSSTPVKLTSLSEFLKALREAAKMAASAHQSKSGRND